MEFGNPPFHHEEGKAKLEALNQLKAERELILEFLGWEKLPTTAGNYNTRYRTSIVIKEDFGGKESVLVLPFLALRFHDNWTLLMEVVEKIEKTGEKTQITIFKSNCGVYVNGFEVLNTNTTPGFWKTFNGDSKIGTTYKACIEFIKWYNKAKDGTDTPMVRKD